MLFGQDGNVSDMIVPDQQGEPYSVELTETGSLDLARWQAQHADKNLIGWAHSHHTLSTVPSVVDVRQQYLYQTENAKIIIVTKSIDGPTKAWRLRQEAMEQLESLDGNVPHGTDTVTLLQDVDLATTEQKTQFWAAEEEDALLERVDRLETKVKEQGNLINKLQSVVDSLQAKCVREPARSARRKRRHSDAGAEGDQGAAGDNQPPQEGKVGAAAVKQPPSAFCSLLPEHPARASSRQEICG